MLPPFEQIRAESIPSDAWLLDRHGEIVSELRFNPNVRRFNWVPLYSLPLSLREALLAAEDKRFFEHSGVDWKAFAGAAWQNLWSKSKRGASTITMQLAGMLDPALRLNAQGSRRNLSQKWNQGVAAIDLEQQWSKEQILEAYFNLVPFRGDLQGIEATSQVLFGMSSRQLTRKESVILVVLLRGPNAPIDRVVRRACVLAGILGESNLCPEITRLAQERLDAPRNAPRYNLAPHLARALINQAGQKQATTLEGAWQKDAVQRVQQVEGSASALMVDNATGEILIWVGAANGSQPDGVSASQALTNWWWPHMAALAIERRTLVPATLIVDPSAVEQNPYNPAFYSLRTSLQDMRAGPLQALMSSMAQNAVSDRLRVLGLPPVEQASDLTAPVSLLQLASAWHTVANAGLYTSLRAVPDPRAMGGRRVVQQESAFLLLDMLNKQRPTEPPEPRWQSSSLNGLQSVQIGSTERYTLLTSVIAAQPLEAQNAAQKLWQEIAQNTQMRTEQRARAPSSLTLEPVEFDPPVESARRDWFFRNSDKEHFRYFP